MIGIKQASSTILRVLSHTEYPLNKLIERQVKFPLSDEVEDSINEVIDSLRYNKGVYEKRGVAISANQVGVEMRFFCLADFKLNSKNLHQRIEVICNPEILSYSTEKSVDDEGCLSIPEYIAYVSRPDKILVRYQNLIGRKVEKELEGFEARVFQHELDHLNGIDMLSKAEKIEENPLYALFIARQNALNKIIT